MMDTPVFPNYIDGQWTDGGAHFENRNPADTSHVVGLFVKGTASHVETAADAAARALPAWMNLNAPARGAILFKAAEILESRLQSVAEDMTREEGKTIAEAKGEVRRAVNIFRYFGGEGSRLNGMLVPSERDRVHMFAIRKPIGVVGLITPWNFPSAIPAWKLAPALICGNTVVLKPASAAPLSAWRLVQALEEAGLPKGVVNFVAGPGGELGRALVEAPPLKAISFTGSCQIGNWLHAEASKRRLRIQLEMGGKNPTIVLADADFNAAVENTINAAFFSTGQKCTATSRVIVENAIYDRFLDAVVERTRKLKIGDGMQPGIDIGPCVDEDQMDTVLRYIEIGRGEAGEPKIGGRRLTGGDLAKGYFVEPTVFADVTPEMTIAREEIFGPVLAVMRARDFEDAMRIANDIPFGLSASIQTTNLSRVFEFVYRRKRAC
jgi:alpha-ketoglutaric semialdehyde dehydrogenase